MATQKPKPWEDIAMGAFMLLLALAFVIFCKYTFAEHDLTKAPQLVLMFVFIIGVACVGGAFQIRRGLRNGASRRNERDRERRQEARIMREIAREEFRNLQEHWRRKREKLATDCDKCGQPAVEAKQYRWRACNHEMILFACERCSLPYEMPCPKCAEERRITLEREWSWLLKAAVFFHLRQRFIDFFKSN
jgi:hypothetical protein